MKVTVLGSGTIVGRTGRNCSGYLLDDRLLLDCGPGIWGALHKSPDRAGFIDTVLVSHFHLDHVADLVSLLFARYVTKVGTEHPLTVFGPVGSKARIGSLLEPHHDWSQEVSYSLEELMRPDTKVGDYLVRTSPTGHTTDSVCFRITDGSGVSIFYSGDTTWNDDVVKLAFACDLAIVEAALPSDTPAPDHLTPRLAGRLAAQAQAKALMLTHCYPEVFAGDPSAEAADSYGGEIILAADDLDLTI